MNSKKSFVCALISLILTVTMSIPLIKFARNNDTQMTSIFASAICIGALFSIVGILFAIYGIREENTIKKFVGIIWNGLISCIFLCGLAFHFL